MSDFAIEATQLVKKFPARAGTGDKTAESSPARKGFSFFRKHAPKAMFTAVNGVDLQIERGEIFGLLGPNGAGKTTLISIICGIVTPTGGRVAVGGHDIASEYRAARALIGLVPQELTTDAFESVWNTVSFSRGLFGKPADPAAIKARYGDRLSFWGSVSVQRTMPFGTPDDVRAEVREQIRQAARRAVARIREFSPWVIEGPVEMRFEFLPETTKAGETKQAPLRVYRGRTVLECFQDWIK